MTDLYLQRGRDAIEEPVDPLNKSFCVEEINKETKRRKVQVPVPNQAPHVAKVCCSPVSHLFLFLLFLYISIYRLNSSVHFYKHQTKLVDLFTAWKKGHWRGC